jgi:hypothetical protein
MADDRAEFAVLRAVEERGPEGAHRLRVIRNQREEDALRGLVESGAILQDEYGVVRLPLAAPAAEETPEGKDEVPDLPEGAETISAADAAHDALGALSNLGGAEKQISARLVVRGVAAITYALLEIASQVNRLGDRRELD